MWNKSQTKSYIKCTRSSQDNKIHMLINKYKLMDITNHLPLSCSIQFQNITKFCISEVLLTRELNRMQENHIDEQIYPSLNWDVIDFHMCVLIDYNQCFSFVTEHTGTAFQHLFRQIFEVLTQCRTTIGQNF
jgi:hypothetical protein